MMTNRADREPLYPLFLDLSGAPVLVVGAGAIAERRVCGLVDAGASVTVVAPTATAVLQEMASEGSIQLEARGFEAADVEGRRLVFSATGDPEVDRAVFAAARGAGILANVADEPDLCDFHVPAVERRGLIQIAVSTGGAAPALAGRLRDRFSASLGPEWERFARLLGAVRDLAAGQVAESAKRMAVLRKLSHSDDLLARIARGEEPDPGLVLQSALAGEDDPGEVEQHEGLVSFVGAGPGKPELITVLGRERLRAADIIIYDDLVDRGLLVEARPDAELIYYGKRGWAGSTYRSGPELLSQKLRERPGARIVRLKGGDPSVFGRLDEELAVLRSVGADYEMIPGVTAALAAAAAAKIPVTKRGVSSHLSLVSAIAVDDEAQGFSVNDVTRLLEHGGTVALYMGRRTLGAVTDSLLEAGIDPSLPVVGVAAAFRPDQRIMHSTLGSAFADVEAYELVSPATFILGWAAKAPE